MSRSTSSKLHHKKIPLHLKHWWQLNKKKRREFTINTLLILKTTISEVLTWIYPVKQICLFIMNEKSYTLPNEINCPFRVTKKNLSVYICTDVLKMKNLMSFTTVLLTYTIAGKLCKQFSYLKYSRLEWQCKLAMRRTTN